MVARKRSPAVYIFVFQQQEVQFQFQFQYTGNVKLNVLIIRINYLRTSVDLSEPLLAFFGKNNSLRNIIQFQIGGKQ